MGTLTTSGFGARMQEQISNAITLKAKALLRQEEKRRYIKLRYRDKYRLRTGLTPSSPPLEFPQIWSLSKHFDPRYCLKRADFLGRVLWQKIQDGSYDPSPAVRMGIPKGNGDIRTIMGFSIPDAAISNLFYRRLRDKNSSLFSPFSYAYFKDRGLFDAVIQLRSYLDSSQAYLVEMDFSKYFDTIEHRYLEHLLENERFNFSQAERTVIGKLLRHRISDRSDYSIHATERRKRGVPQGSSISLFLANLAGHELDRSLEQINGRFVRFADDVAVVTKSYSDAVKVTKAFERHCNYSGISINHDKSDGISLLRPASKLQERSFFVDRDDGHHINVKDSFDFIGHKFTRQSTLLSDRSIRRAKARISKIIYLNLLYPLQFGAYNPARTSGSGFDWDLVNCINEIRRFVYGHLSEHELRRFVDGGTRIRAFRGFLGFCPLVDSVQQFAALDGWMVDVLRRGLNERYRRMSTQGFSVPAGRTPARHQLIDGSWFSHTSYDLETRLPSFALAWRASRKRFKLLGLDAFENPSYYSSVSSGFFY